MDSTADLIAEPQGATPGMGDGLRNVALRNALGKRQAGVATYTVAEAAVLLSVSTVHLYRLIQADSFPAVLMALHGKRGRYVVPAAAVERLLGDVAAGTSCVDVAAWTTGYRAERSAGRINQTPWPVAGRNSREV
jgi:excisionase family DNA binding protein